MRYWVITIFIYLCTQIALGDFHSDGLNFGKSRLNDVTNKIGDSKDVVPHFNQNPKEVSLSESELEDKKNKVAKEESTAVFIGESVKKKPKVDLNFKKEKWFTNSKSITKYPEKIISPDCQGKDNTKAFVVQKEQEDLGIKYTKAQCLESVEVEHMCDRKLKVTCVEEGQCHRAGIKEKSIESDMLLEYKPPIMTLGNLNYSGWGGNCSVYERTTTFSIKNKNKLQEFRLIKAYFDDYIEVRVNDHIVYAGPDGHATKAELKKVTHPWVGEFTVVEIGDGRNYPCERNTFWRRDINIDLLPYIKEGENEIFVRLIVTSEGSLGLEFKIDQQCCHKWQDDWIDDCEALRK